MSNPVRDQLQQVYNNQYSSDDTTWRDLGALGKARNLAELCAPLGLNHFLDVGAGDGAVLAALNKFNFNLTCTALEISESGVDKILKRNLSTVKEVRLFDGYKIPFEDKTFELATCSHVIEHVEHPRLLLREIHRVSEYQYFEIPIDFSFFVDNKVKHYLSYGHINIFTPSLFKFLLKSEGFEVVNEKFVFYDDAVHKMLHRNSFPNYAKSKIKNTIMNAIPFLRKIKPNAYGVLTRSTGKEGLVIF